LLVLFLTLQVLFSFLLAETLEKTQLILQQFKYQIDKGIPIIGAGAGTGISAKFEEAGGVDLIVLYNSGRFRMAGRGSLAGLLPFADANAVVLDMANEVLPVRLFFLLLYFCSSIFHFDWLIQMLLYLNFEHTHVQDHC
jgi:hypothetical protein